MMRILGVDTSTACGSLGLIDDHKVVAEYALLQEETHSARLVPAIQAILKEARLDIHEMDGMAISLGPGSFTGLRVGLSVVKGLALAVAKPVVGVPTLDALAHNLPFTPYLICPLLDARKGELYTALYQDGEGGEIERLTPYQVLPPTQLLENLPVRETVFLGYGVDLCRGLIEKQLGAKALFAPPHLRFLRGTTVAELGMKRLLQGDQDDIASLAPIYVRPSDAEINWAKNKSVE
jgi:tRNA threonylcarbamoyladenosine biosynthesis protein TsaB